MERTVNVTFESSCSTGYPGACLVFKSVLVVELFVVQSCWPSSVLFMLIHTGSVAALHFQPVWLVVVSLLEQGVCLRYFQVRNG